MAMIINNRIGVVTFTFNNQLSDFMSLFVNSNVVRSFEVELGVILLITRPDDDSCMNFIGVEK